MADEKAVRIRNPFGEEMSVMRTSMIPSMLKVIRDNLKEENTEARLFEIGRVYVHDNESDMLCVGLYGENEDFYTLNNILQEILDSFKVNTAIKRYIEMPFHPGRAAQCGDFAKLGEINPIVLQDYEIQEKVYIAEIDIKKLFEQSSDKIVYTPIIRYPAAFRDLSLVCDEDTESKTIVEIIEESCSNILENVEYITLFKGGNLADRQKSISYKLTFRKSDGTLTGEEVDESIKRILLKLEEKNIKLRG